MSILLDESARVAIMGISGRLGRFSVHDLADAGTTVVAGVSPTRAGERVRGIPVVATMAEAVAEHGANCALVYVPARFALDALIETTESGCRLAVYPGDGLPVVDAIRVRDAASANGMRVVGPNTPGVISPGKAKLGFMPGHCYRRGPVGIISRSGSLSYEVAAQLSRAGIGQTTVIGIGGDPVKGVTAEEAVALFDDDPETEAIVYLGEIGGSDEYAVADYATRAGAKPVAALLVGRTAPAGKKMGHAAAMIGASSDTWDVKVEALDRAGVAVATRLEDIAEKARSALDSSPRKTLATEDGEPR